MKAQVLLYEHECGSIGADVLVKNKPIGHGYSTNPRIDLSLEHLGQKSAYHLHSNGITFGEYEIINGKTCLSSEGIGKIKDPRVYSIINFAILNEMMRLTSSLSPQAA